MESGAKASMASGSVAQRKDQSLQRIVNKNESQPQSSSSSSSTHASPPQKPPSNSTKPKPPHNKDDITTHKVKMADRGDSLLVLLIILAMFAAISAALVKVGVSWKGFITGIVAFVVAVSMRILYLNRGYKIPILKHTWNAANVPPANLLDGVPAAYFLYVLGSGGHTAEMSELLRLTCSPAPNVHRRYVFTTGDTNSLNAIINFENRVKESFGNEGGTWDTYQVKRARNVHQPLYTTWFTSLLSLMSIYEALTTPPDDRHAPQERKLFKFPHVITTNGPGNGVMVAVVARLLKIFFLAPNNCMKVVFIETWAHVQTLSLTGKIFHWARYVGGLVDVYFVQHQPLAEKYGYKEFDFITPTLRH